MANKKHKCKCKCKKKELITNTKPLKVIVTFASGITVVLVLFITVGTVIKPYYQMQRDIDTILIHIQEQSKQQSYNLNDIKLVERDVEIIVRSMHTLLRIESGEEVSNEDVKELLQYFEESLIYMRTKSKENEASDQGNDAIKSIEEITRTTLENLRKLQ